ncbi:GNAT family N-acetyltransferase [uncultured Clostridium sp.]|uniref:GNAT family N-acetyltransferase n=1 Tax=uncultured Clostridium sp. TaxID=59620 RepID=UPI00261DA82C|nr:GNAT family N-acetyltransferase [uncultured Clostridium sp.]
MVKKFKDLSKEEIDKVRVYLNKAEKNNKSIEEIKKEFNEKIYDYGEGVLVSFKENEIIGKVLIVLEAVNPLSVIYIHSLDIDENIVDGVSIVKELLKEAIKIGEDKKCNKILLGIKNERILKILSDIGYEAEYKSYIMKLENRKTVDTTLELISLSENNKVEYLDIFNRSFSDMPHGCYYEREDIEKYLKDNSLNKYYLVSDKNNIIGFMNIDICDNVGSFDIGLCKEYRGIGYGKKL